MIFFLHEHIVKSLVPLNLWPITLLHGFANIHQCGLAFGNLYSTWPGSSCVNCLNEMGPHCTCIRPIATAGGGVCLWENPSPLDKPHLMGQPRLVISKAAFGFSLLSYGMSCLKPLLKVRRRNCGSLRAFFRRIRKRETAKWLFHPTAKHTLTSFKNASAACVMYANMVLPFNWEAFFPVKLAVGISVEGLVGVLSQRSPSKKIEKFLSLFGLCNWAPQRKNESENTCIFLSITNSEAFRRQLFFRKGAIFLIILCKKKHENVWDFKVTPEGITSSSEGWNARQHPREYPGFRKTDVGCCYQCYKEP